METNAQSKSEPQKFGCEIIEIAERLGQSLISKSINSTSLPKNSLLEQSIGKSKESEEDEDENCCEESATTKNEYLDQRFTGKLLRGNRDILQNWNKNFIRE